MKVLRLPDIGQQFHTYLREEPRDKQSPLVRKLQDEVLINRQWAVDVGNFNRFDEGGWS